MSNKGPPGSPGGPLTLDLVSITHALLVAECLSFRRAAKVLGIRQSTVSRRVRSLEDVLGVSLFERYNGGVRVTAAGARFFDQARDALLQPDYAVKSASAAGRGAITLEQTFGTEYESFRTNVPRWIPRLTPWRAA